MTPVGSEADAVRLVEDVIDDTSDHNGSRGYEACNCRVTTSRTGSAVIEALIEAGWVAPYSVAEPTEPGARVIDREGDTWERVPSGAWRLYVGWTPMRWDLVEKTYGPLRLVKS